MEHNFVEKRVLCSTPECYITLQTNSHLARFLEFTLRGGYYYHTLRHVANLFYKIIFYVQGHLVMLVQVTSTH